MGVSGHFIFRLDVDTELCLREGIDPLCEIADRFGIPLSFFINPGRAIDRRLLLREALCRYRASPPKTRAPTFGSVTKLGWSETARLLLINPRILPRHTSKIRRIVKGGHGIGLHGGRNHATWQRLAATWGRERLANEVSWGKGWLEATTDMPVTAFASPGWNSPHKLPEVLSEQGFDVIADQHDGAARPTQIETASGPLVSVPNTLAGEPGGVGFFESRRAAGLDDAKILAELDKELGRKHEFLCLYDHPFYAGRKAVSLFEATVALVLAHGYRVVTCQMAAQAVAST